jgi:hypothetical protein
MIVPRDLQKVVGKSELRYSLKTGYLSVAKYKARILAGQVQRIFNYLRKGDSALSDLSDGQIKKLIHQYITEYTTGLEQRYLKDEPPPFEGVEGFNAYVEGLDDIRDDVVGYLGVGEYHTVESTAISLLEKNGIREIEKDTGGFIQLCRGILQAQLKLSGAF